MITEVVAALIWNNDKFMICQRPAHKARGLLWEFVGGKVESGETKEQALIRECKEELDVPLSVGDVFMDVVHEYPNLTVHLTLFNATISEGVPQKLEHNDIQWITPSEIPNYEFCPADKEILNKIKKKEKGMSIKQKQNKKEIGKETQKEVLDNNKKTQEVKNKLQNFLKSHPLLNRIVDQIDDISNKFMIGYLAFAFVLISIPVIICYYYLPEGIRKEISVIIGTILSVIIVPSILNAYNRKKENDRIRFNINKDLYFELTKLLIPILHNENFKSEDVSKIEDCVISHYNVICISFSPMLLETIGLLFKYFESGCYKNIKYFAKKIIKIIRKECGNKKDFYIPSFVGKGKMKNYETEARERWGNTDAYREHEKKTKNYTKEKWAEANDGLMAIFAEFAACKQNGAEADSNEVQALVIKLQAYITENYYTCIDEILLGLGQMYVADERFKKNIDKYGEGTAEFAAEGIRIYVKKK